MDRMGDFKFYPVHPNILLFFFFPSLTNFFVLYREKT